MSSKNKTRKNRKTKSSNNTTRKDWHKNDSERIRFVIDKVGVLDKNDKFKVRFEVLKPGVTKYLPEDKPNDIRRQWPKGKDNWKPEDIIKFEYLVSKYKKQRNYKLTEEDKVNIRRLLNPKGIQEDEDTPTPI